VIITNNDLKNSSGDPNYHDLVGWKEQKGVSATIVTVEEIMADPDYDCDGIYGDGCGTGDDFNDTQAHIRNFIKDAYQNWGAEYVLLGGDGDGADVGGESGDNTIPARLMWTGLSTYRCSLNEIPSDLYYAALDGSWDADGDSIWGEPGEEDLYAEVFIGRAPVDSEAELSNFVCKTITYEDESKTASYLRKALMVGEKLWSSPLTWGGDYKDEIKDGSDAHGYTTEGFPEIFDVDTLYDRDWPGNYWPKSELINRINSNLHITNHIGHCNNTYCMKLINSDVDNSLTNDKPFLGYSQGCYAGAFDNRTPPPPWANCGYISHDAIAEHLTTNNSHGAFAFIANTRFGWGLPGSTNGPSQRFDREFFDALFGENIVNVGKANQDSKEDNAGLISNAYIRWCYYQITLFGDPETEINVAPYPDVYRFYIQNPSGETVAWFGNLGNLVLKGTLTQETTPTATANDEFRFQDSNGVDVAIIDTTNGEMYIAGEKHEGQDMSLLSPEGFIIKNSDGDVVAYIDDSGELYLTGKLYQNANP